MSPNTLTRSRRSARTPTTVVPEPAKTLAIRIMGELWVDEHKVRGSKPLELVTALALAGGQMTRLALTRRIYMDIACDSAIPTLCYRARRLGIAVEYDASRALYRLVTPVDIDALKILRLADAGKPAQALALWNGTCLASSDTPLASSLRLNVERCLVRAVLDAGDPDLTVRAARTMDSLELAEAAIKANASTTRPDPWTSVLMGSFLEGVCA